MPSIIVECAQVHKHFGDFTAIDGVSFSINKGGCFGLLGPNGAGKSTIISMIYGVASRSDGQMSVFGMDPLLDAREIKKRLGVVTQENYLDASMSVRENMLMFARFKGLPKKNRGKQVDELLEFMALKHKSNEPIQSLSGGMQRRLVFVRALLGSPELIILDEPTTGLDPAVRHLLWDKINELKARGTTILLTTHYMDEAERLCDRIVIMDQGKVKDIEHPKRLIDKYCPGFVASFLPNQKFEQELESLAATNVGLFFSKDSSSLTLRASSLKELESFVSETQTDPIMMRPSNLEDVFLEVTGKELSANA